MKLKKLLKSKKLLNTLIALVTVYAILGFFILPLIIKSQIEKQASQLLKPQLSIHSIDINPFSMKFALNKLLIKDENSDLVKFEKLYLDFSLLKSMHKRHLSFKQVYLDGLFVNIKQDDNGVINLTTLLKEQHKKDEQTPKKQSSGELPVNFKITKTLLKNAHIKMALKGGDNPIGLEFKDLNYTFYELGNFKNSLASHSFNTTINKDTTINIDGGFNLIPFKMYGKIDIKNIHTDEYLPYASNLLKFTPQDAQIDINLGYQLDLSKELQLNIDEANLHVRNIALKQNGKNFTSLKEFKVNNASLRYPQQQVSIESIEINQPFAHAIMDKKGALNFANLISNQDGHRVQKVKEKRAKGEDIWNVDVKTINLKEGKLLFDDYKSKTKLATNNVNLNLNETSLLGTLLKLKDANLTIDSVNVKDANSKTTVKSNKFALKLSNITKNKEQIHIKKINILQPYAKVDNPQSKIIARNINLNINELSNSGNSIKVKNSFMKNPKVAVTVKKSTTKKVDKNKDSKKDKKKKVSKKSATKKAQNKEPAMNLNVGPFKISNANVLFEDQNLPIPFKSNITKLNGNFSELITKSAKPTKLKLEGQVDRYGYTKITGFVDHKNIKNLTDVQLLFKNIAIKNFTPYSGKFVGRELAGGKLNLNLKYNITKSNIDAKNSIIITDIKLGKQIQSPDAMSLPLELAIALMEDSNGVIDLNVPISGNVDDPQFSLAPIVWKAFSNLIVKAITSPFRFLASLFDFDEEEIKSIEFTFGSHQLLASEKETLDKIAQIFAKRPNIALKVQPSFNQIADTKALQTLKLEAHISKVEKSIKKGEDKYLLALEQSYETASKTHKDLEDMDDVEDKFDGKDGLDKQAYAHALKTALIAKEVITPKELEDLATKRAQALYSYLNSAHKIEQNRVLINELPKDNSSSKEWAVFNLEIDVKK